MTPRYIVHIGPMKTASTYLQQSLTAARHDLLQHGICYPQEFISESNKFMHMPIHHALARKRGEELRPQFEKLNAAGHKVIVLSCEHFIFLKPEAMRTLKDITGAQDYQVVYTARRWSDRASSLWNQALFMGSPDTLPEFYLSLLAGQAPKYYPKWMAEQGAAADLDYSISWRLVEEVFGRAALRIFPYSTIMDRGEDVFEAFCRDVLGLAQAPTTDLAGERRWASMPTEDQEILRVLNSMHLQAGGEEDGSVRALFMRRRKDLATDQLAADMADQIARLEIDDNAVQFNAPFEAMQAYADCVTGGDILFERKAKQAKYVRPGYLLREGALETLRGFYNHLVAAGAETRRPKAERKRAGKV